MNRFVSFIISLAFVSYCFWMTNALGYLFFRKKHTNIATKVAQSCYHFRNKSKNMFFSALAIRFILLLFEI